MPHHEIVALETIHQPLLETFNFPPGTTYNLTKYYTHDASKLHERIRPATIVIVTTIKLDSITLSPDVTPNLQLVAVMATGTDPVDLEACKKRGIRVTNSPAANLDAVSEHAISLYFAGRRRTAILDRLTRQVPSEWKSKGSLTGYLKFGDGKPPLVCSEEVMGVIGYGGLGKRIAKIGRALGMQVLVASRKNAPEGIASDNILPPPASTSGPNTTSGASEGEPERVPFNEVLRQSTVLFLSLPRNPSTLNLLSTPEFAIMHPYCVLVNISRGGIVDEAAVVEALRNHHIAGYGTDVFEKEPAEGEGESVLLGEEARQLNVTVSPHLAWFSQRTLKNLGRILGETVEGWVAGKAINVIV